MRGVEQRVLREFTPAAEAIAGLFPELGRDDHRRMVLFLETLAPKPLGKENLLFLRIKGAGKIEGVFSGENKAVPRIVFEENPSGLERRQEVKKANGVVVWLSGGSLTETGQLGEILVGSLRPESSIWFLERAVLTADGSAARNDTLEGMGLVARKVVQKGTICLSYGRTEKDRRISGVDLTVKPYFRPILEEARRMILAKGWAEVNAEEAVDKCRHSKFPPRDLENLKLGFGVKVAAYCGCSWHVDLNGGWKRLWQCSEECPGEPRPNGAKKLTRQRTIVINEEKEKQPGPSAVKERLLWVGKTIPTEIKCKGCGGTVLGIIEDIGPATREERAMGPVGRSRPVTVCQVCGSCGLIHRRGIRLEPSVLIREEKRRK